MPADFKSALPNRDPELLRSFRLENAGTLCWMCDMRPGIHIHHRIKRSQGGDNEHSNLAWLCGGCHDGEHGIRSEW